MQYCDAVGGMSPLPERRVHRYPHVHAHDGGWGIGAEEGQANANTKAREDRHLGLQHVGVGEQPEPNRHAREEQCEHHAPTQEPPSEWVHVVDDVVIAHGHLHLRRPA